MNLNPLPQRIKYFKDKHLNNGKWPDHIQFSISTLKTIEAGETSLELGQFIPCLNGKPLEKPLKPIGYDKWKTGEGGADGIKCVVYQKAFQEFEQAEQKVLFKGWEYKHYMWNKGGGVKEKLSPYIYCEAIKRRFHLNENAHNNLSNKTIEDISHLNLELTEQGEKELI